MNQFTAEISIGTIHFRKWGSGCPIILLHASPRNSSSFEGFAAELSKVGLQVIAPDTPGYGRSAAPAEAPENLEVYADLLDEFITSIGLEKCMIYGTATGAQLGICYTNKYPSKVQHLFLDNAAHFSEEERKQVTDRYFLDLKPREDGSHLEEAWRMGTGLFKYFPWFMEDDEHRLNYPEMPVGVLNKTVMEFLENAKKYDWAYRCAFDHERVENVRQLTVPVDLFRWKGSILLKYIDTLIDLGLPENVHVKEIEAAMAGRYQTMANIIADKSWDFKQTSNANFSKLELGSELKMEKENYPVMEPSGKYLMECWEQLKREFPIEDATLRNLRLTKIYN